MNTITTDWVSQEGSDEERELVELGKVSQKTKGGYWGWSDGGGGWFFG